MWLFLTVEAVNKDIKSKIIFSDNHFNDILRQSDFMIFYQIFC